MVPVIITMTLSMVCH